MLAETPSICLTENLELAIAEVQELLLDGNPDDGMKLLVIFIDDSGQLLAFSANSSKFSGRCYFASNFLFFHLFLAMLFQI